MGWLSKDEEKRRADMVSSDEFAAMIASNMTYREIGAKTGMSGSSVARYAARLGINRQRQTHSKQGPDITLATAERLPVGTWIMTAYPTSSLNGLSGTIKPRPAKIVKVHSRYYECVTATGQRVCEPIVGAKRVTEIGGQGHASQRLGKN